MVGFPLLLLPKGFEGLLSFPNGLEGVLLLLPNGLLGWFEELLLLLLILSKLGKSLFPPPKGLALPLNPPPYEPGLQLLLLFP